MKGLVDQAMQQSKLIEEALGKPAPSLGEANGLPACDGLIYRDRASLIHLLNEKERLLDQVRSSLSWRLTAPLRGLRSLWPGK